ncbi:phenoloxidase-activating factor 3-like [Pollicipes pollicipes]|uniref:phenoloxidase-activating factor 3-like n=1 Tax=Pollicipes pollicipes TaxID=41117 RepID=UPI0018851883|nr:phenoloxidase-activating factor 3-like [Pollicipes pollicipes]
MCGVLQVCTVLLLAVSSALGADLAWQRISLEQRQTTLLPGLADHPALGRLDLRFCGSGSESQLSRGPLGCGFPVVGDHPWLVALGFTGPDGRVVFSCSGALISDQHVVTSARCALGTRGYMLSTVRLGEYDFSSRRDCLWYDPTVCTEATDVAVHSLTVHPDFVKHGGDPSRFDMALVQLSKPVTLGHGVQPICLPMFPLRHQPHRLYSLTMGLHSGPQPERSTTTHVMDEERLALFNTSYDGPGPCQYRLLSEADGEPNRCLGSGTPCVADLGAPLVAPDQFGSAYFLMGVASMRPAQRECHRPGVSVSYAPVRPHVSWILDSLALLASI